MTYRYPAVQIVSFGFLAVGGLIFSISAVYLIIGKFVWPRFIEGNEFYWVLLDIPIIVVAVGCWVAFRYLYSRKRPIVIDQAAITSLDFFGRIKAELPWDNVTKINRQLLYDPISYKNAWCFDVFGSGEKTISFDDTIGEYQSLVAELNSQIAAHNIEANSIMRGPDALQGVTDPTERRRLIKYGRPSRVASFDEMLGSEST
jgi:hypothetical protein